MRLLKGVITALTKWPLRLDGVAPLNLAKTSPHDWIGTDSTVADVDRIVTFLTEQGTFRFPSLPNGLFSAAAGEGDDFALTGYANIWVRDNIHIAHAHWVIGDNAAAVKTVRAITDFYRKYQHRFTDIIKGRADASEPMQRPHVRFRGDLTELPEKWSHAQNDALGYWLWLTSKLAIAGDLVLEREDVAVLVLLLKYWETIEYWQDEDSGHWEETRKVSMSSIGVAVGGLEQFKRWLISDAAKALLGGDNSALKLAHELSLRGREVLMYGLPNECVQDDPAQQREYDSALLFLHYPIDVLPVTPGGDAEIMILDHVRGNLQGEFGIRRYLGDSYWCADYKTLLKADERTADFSDNIGARDSLLKPGLEAQWCLFDPILSVIYGRRYQRTGHDDDRFMQRIRLQRSLSQLTTSESRFGAYRCPESYYCEAGKWVPNDITPLLWTQANLRLALYFMRQTLAGAENES